MPNASPSARSNRLLLPVLGLLMLASMAAVAYVVLAWNDIEETGVEEQSARAATATRTRLVRLHRAGRVASGALIAEPRDQWDVRAMVEFCDTATAGDVPALRDVALMAQSPLAAGNAVRALGRLHAVAKDADLLKLLADPRVRVRDELFLALGESRDTSALAVLEPFVRAGDEHVRVLAIHAVGRIGGERARTMLEQVSAESPVTPEIAAFARAGLAASTR